MTAMAAPVIGLTTFLIVFMAVLLIARIGVEVYVRHTKQSPQDRGNGQAGANNSIADNNAIQRYYNTFRNNNEYKGA